MLYDVTPGDEFAKLVRERLIEAEEGDVRGVPTSIRELSDTADVPYGTLRKWLGAGTRTLSSDRLWRVLDAMALEVVPSELTTCR